MEMSDKHGARMDDELTKDTRAGHEEIRQLDPDDARIDVVQTQDGVLDDHEAAARSEVARFLQPSSFPARMLSKSKPPTCATSFACDFGRHRARTSCG